MTGKRHRLAIHTVFLPRENLLFIKEWLAYHTLLGVEHFYLYDNTGSVGRMGSTSTVNKYGLDFHALTQGLSDAETGAVMDSIFREFPGRITLVDWRPRNPRGDIEYAQEDAIRHCVAQFGADTAWLCVIDMDEFLFSPGNEKLSALLDELESRDCSRTILQQKKFADRFDRLNRLVVEIEDCIDDIDTSGWGPKTILRSDAFDPDGAWNVHDIGVRRGRTCRLDPGRLRFNHYNVNSAQLQWMQAFYQNSAPFALNAQDRGMRRYRRPLYRACRSYGSIWWRRAILDLSGSAPRPI